MRTGAARLVGDGEDIVALLAVGDAMSWGCGSWVEQRTLGTTCSR
jgi:hypothetical protein